MLKNIELRNKRLQEDIDFLLAKGKKYVEAIEIVAFKYGICEETTEKAYVKTKRQLKEGKN
ncbi:hypothetical protein [Raineya sp.]